MEFLRWLDNHPTFEWWLGFCVIAGLLARFC
jgi:hypothetical protein